jgi:cardiolipin synthase
MAREQIPNLLSSLRIALIIPVIWAILAGYPLVALIIFIIAGLTDILDGWLARREDWETPVGGILDGVADKLLLISVYLSLWWLDSIPLWLIATLFGRDLLLGLGCLLYRARVGKFAAAPIPTGKLHTLFQICLVILILAQASLLPIITQDLLIGVMRMLVITAVFSLLGYARQGYRDMRMAYYQKLHDAEKQA